MAAEDAVILPEYSIRLMREEEIPAVLELWKETGLSEGTHSLYTWYCYDPEGFYVAVAEDGEILGVCAGILQNEDLAFLGMYAVKRTYQRRGIGSKIWDTVMERVGERNAGVNPVPSQLSNYRDKAGFSVQTTWKTVVCVSPQIQTDDIIQELPGHKVCHLSTDHPMMIDVANYDESVYGFRREGLVELVAAEFQSITMFAVDRAFRVCGYGSIRENIKGNAMIGPLYADNLPVAEILVWNLVENFPLAKKRGLTLMIVDANEDASDLVSKLGLKKQPGLARLYRKADVQVEIPKVFGQHNLNFAVF